MRQKGASIFIYLIFGLLIVIFVINFAPQGGGRGSGCGTNSNAVVDVNGTSANKTAFHIAYSNPFNPGRGANDRKYVALDTLIRRELLAQAATERGLRVTGTLIEEEIEKGNFFLGGLRIPLEQNVFDLHEDGTKTWNIAKFKNWIHSLDITSMGTYKDEQQRALAATLMAEMIASSVRVSRDEALDEYLFDHNTVTYDAVAFQPAAYREAMRLTDADIARFIAGHEDDVKARYKADERTYKGTKPSLKLRQIFIAKAEPEASKPDDKGADATKPADAKREDKKPADAKQADAKKPEDKKPADANQADAKKPEDKKAADDKKAGDAKKAADDKKAADAKAAGAKKPAGLPIEEAKAKLEAARTAATGNKQKFIDAAKQLNTEDAAKTSAGDLGWHTVDSPGLGDKAVNDAIKALKPGEMTPVIATDRGAYLILAEDKREGDLSYDQVKSEIAADLARDVWSKEAAKRAALDALAQATASGKKLDELYQRAVKPARPGGGIEELLNDPNTSDEVKQMILEQMRKQMQGKHGSITFETKDVPAAWKADDAGGSSGGSSSGSAAKGSAGSGSAAGSGASSSSAGAGSGSGAPVTPPVDKPAPLAPSKDVLPAFGDVPKPSVVKEGPTPRMPQLPGVGKDMIPVLFDELSAGMLAKQVSEADGGYVIVQVLDKSQAKIEDFDKDAAGEIQKLRDVRGRIAVEEWLRARCTALVADGKIRPSPEYVHELDDKGKVTQNYKPCGRLSAIAAGR